MRRTPGRPLLALLAGFLIVTGCAGEPTKPSAEDGTLMVRADVSATTVAMVVVVVTGPGISTPLTFNLTVSNGAASGTITLPAGSQRTITIHAYDGGGTETHSGSVTVNVTSGTNAAVTLILDALTGQAPITVTLGTLTITVTPSPATVAAGATVTLTATITGADGSPIAGTVTWATSNPGVATVAAGVVTGVAAGQTTIVATYNGFAGSGTVNVTGP